MKIRKVDQTIKSSVKENLPPNYTFWRAFLKNGRHIQNKKPDNDAWLLKGKRKEKEFTVQVYRQLWNNGLTVCNGLVSNLSTIVARYIGV